MKRAGENCIVEVEDMRTCAVDQRRVERIETFPPSKDRGLRRPGKRLYRAEGSFHSCMSRCSDRAGKEVEHGARGFVAHGWIELVRALPGYILRNFLRHLAHG